MMKKRKRKEVLGIIISSEDKRDIGRIVKFSPKRLDKIEKRSKIKREDFLNPAHEEIMKLYKRYYSGKKFK
ncbi:MAG: hypothetical protein N3G74_01605 [Candidatus Micrarchaeota archaeon]|nr:hypothetical protein [Candidatus Micrarchaeota archaeon]